MPFDGKENLIILPTYNERRNIEGIVANIFEVLPLTNILIVDDNSPDGTGRLAEELAKNDERIFVLHRRKNRGLGPPTLMDFNGLSKENTIVSSKWMPTLVINPNTFHNSWQR